jgi:hypothetical protein
MIQNLFLLLTNEEFLTKMTKKNNYLEIKNLRTKGKNN